MSQDTDKDETKKTKRTRAPALRAALAAALLALPAAAPAAVPVRWEAEATRPRPARFTAYRGETLELEAAVTAGGRPLPGTCADPSLWWQTNGMGAAWWRAPASCASNVLRAVWSPTNDAGAAEYSCFIGEPGGSWRAAFRLRMLDSPGAAPNELPLPAREIDFAAVEVANAPWADAAAVDAAVGAASNALAAAVAAVSNETALVYRLYSGSNVVAEVTNYNSLTRGPRLRLLQLTESNAYEQVWAEADALAELGAALTNRADAAAAAAHAAATNASAPRAWSRSTSGLGADAPEGWTWVSTPAVALAGGYEWEKRATAGGTFWVLAAAGMALAPAANSFLALSAADGAPLLTVEKTDSYLVPVRADGISVEPSGWGDACITVTVPADTPSPPTPWGSRTLAGPWQDLTDYSDAAWRGAPGAWVFELFTSAPSYFLRFEAQVPGRAVIRHAAPYSPDGGILCTDGVHAVRPVWNGGSVTWEAVP